MRARSPRARASAVRVPRRECRGSSVSRGNWYCRPVAEAPSASLSDAQPRASGAEPMERLADEFARVATAIELLRKLLLIGGLVVIVLMIIAVILELNMYHLVQQIKGGG